MHEDGFRAVGLWTTVMRSARVSTAWQDLDRQIDAQTTARIAGE